MQTPVEPERSSVGHRTGPEIVVSSSSSRRSSSDQEGAQQQSNNIAQTLAEGTEASDLPTPDDSDERASPLNTFHHSAAWEIELEQAERARATYAGRRVHPPLSRATSETDITRSVWTQPTKADDTVEVASTAQVQSSGEQLWVVTPSGPERGVARKTFEYIHGLRIFYYDPNTNPPKLTVEKRLFYHGMSISPTTIQ